MYSEIIQSLSSRAGRYEGWGVNHEELEFVATLELQELTGCRAVLLKFKASSPTGELLHDETTWIAFGSDEKVSLWSINSNNPMVLEHELRRIEGTDGNPPESFVFGLNDPEELLLFREEIAIELHPDGSLVYRYAWGMPGGNFKPRSSATLHRVT